MYKVWIVDDEPLVTEGLKRQVNWESYNMELAGSATNGYEVLDALKTEPAQLLITDISMPQIDGLTLITEVKKICPAIRCVVISAYNEFGYVKKALQLGVENYLLKPINNNELHDTLSTTMKNLLRDQMAVSRESPDLLAFRTNILDRWVNDTIQEFELFERGELLRMNLSSPFYAVCVLDIAEPADPQDRFRYSSQLLDICRVYLRPSPDTECFIDGAFRVVAIVPSPEADTGRLLDDIDRVHAEVSAEGIQIFAAVAPAAPGLSNVSASYRDAVLHLNCRYLDPGAATVVCEAPVHASAAAPNDGHSLVPVFEKALREGALQQAQQAADKYILLRAGGTTGSRKKAMVPLALALIRAMIESGKISQALPSEIVSSLSEFAHLPPDDGAQPWLNRMIRQAIQVIHERKGSYHLLIHLTLEQVHNNYGSELSLKTLATTFNVSPAYLGQLFREETGKYFSDYLTEVRMQASRALLLETDLKINEITARIGMPNQSYFNRVFKKMYNLSPLEFRRQGFIRQP